VTLNAELAVGDVQQHVEVTGEAPQIETTNATISGLVSQDQIRDLPLNGRSVDQLALLSPGVFANRTSTANTTVGLGMHLSVNGSRPDSMLYLLDGTVVNDYTNNGHGSAAGQSLGVEGILEFRLLTHNFSAEYGRNAGGVISAVTRSGTNEFHGSVFEFVRNNIFDARSPFNPGALPPFRRNQFGAAAGGPVIKSRIFFFANYEGLRQRQGNTITSTVPDLNARMGLIPDPLNPGSLKSTPLNTAMIPYINVYPTPTPGGRNFGDGTAQSIANFSQPAREDYTMMRMDFRFSDKDTFYWRYVFDPSESENPEAVPTFVTPFYGIDHLVILSETHIFSTASLNEFRFAFNRTNRAMNSIPLGALDPSLSLTPGVTFGTFTVSGTSGGSGQLSTLGINMGGNQFNLQNLFQETDTFSTVRVAHSLKFGIDVERQQLDNLFGPREVVAFGGLTSFLAGTATSITAQSPQSGTRERGWRRILFGAFVQDDFRLRHNLTLNLGLREEFFTNPSEVSGLSGALLNVTDKNNTPGPPFQTPKANFAPRVGLAWDPTGSGKTAVRLGGGIFYNELDGRTWLFTAGQNSDYFKSFGLKNVVFPQALAGGLPLNAVQGDTTVQFYSKTPTVIQWNLEVQRQLSPTISLRTGYVGSHGYHLAVATALDIRIPQIQADGSKFFSTSFPFVNPSFSSIGGINTEAVSGYNALQVVLQKTLSAGLTLQASFTYSKAMSDADQIVSGQQLSTASDPLDVNDIGRDNSLSAYDQRRTFVLNGSYLMPWEKRLQGRVAKAALGGWSANWIYSYGSGLALDILDGFNNSANGDTNNPDRPNQAPGYSSNPISGLSQGNTTGNPNCTANLGPKAGIQLHTPALWFDPCAFIVNPAGTYGNLGRNTVTAPGFNDFDFSVAKITQLTETKKLEFRAESFNLFNHAQFGLPNNSISSSSRTYSGNAGVISTITSPNRQIQFGMKLVF
jgi:hypothetical protein